MIQDDYSCKQALPLEIGSAVSTRNLPKEGRMQRISRYFCFGAGCGPGLARRGLQQSGRFRGRPRLSLPEMTWTCARSCEVPGAISQPITVEE